MRADLRRVVLMVGSLAMASSLATAGPPIDGVALSDWNHDGRADIGVLADARNGSMFAYFMDGPIILGAGPLPASPVGWNNSGYPPVGADGAAGVSINDGTTEFAYRFDIENFAATNITSATVFNYSGVQANAGYANEALVIDIGGGFLFKAGLDGLGPDTSNTGTLPGPPSGFTLGGYPDINGDGTPDVAIFGPAIEGFLFVWLIGACNGTDCAVIDAFPVAGPPAGWTLLGFPDLDGDGKNDVLISRDSDGVIFAYLTDGDSGIVGNTPGGATFAAVGDVTGEGNDDIVWDIGGGFLFLWPMDGLTVGAGAPLPGPPVGTFSFPGMQSQTPLL